MSEGYVKGRRKRWLKEKEGKGREDAESEGKGREVRIIEENGRERREGRDGLGREDKGREDTGTERFEEE